jgi:branched-chain amino acid transport system permease protein
MPGASLYLLKRYYLGGAEAAASVPPPEDVRAGLSALPAPLAYLAQQVLAGLPGMALYGLLGAAYALVFGLVGRINLAFGEIAAVGAAAAGLGVALVVAGGLTATLPGLAAGTALAILAGALHSVVTGKVAFGWIGAGRTQASLIATIGLSLVLMEYLRLAGGTVPAWIPPVAANPVALARAGTFIVTLTPIAAITALCGIAAATALVWLMRGSAFGRAWRAQADDPVAAALFGIDGRRLLTHTLLLAGGLAGLAGALTAIQFGALGFAGGFQLGLKALAAAILGGVASVGGALLGGLAIGVIETLWSAYGPIAGRDLALDLVLVAAIVLRPNGFAGCPPPHDRP